MSTESPVVAEAIWAEIQEIGPLGFEPHIPGYSKAIEEDYRRRNQFRKRFGFSVPARSAVTEIVRFLAGDSVIEVGAGRGLWAYLLSVEGVKVDATDKFTPTESGYSDLAGSDLTFLPIRKADAIEAAKAAAQNCLMFVWPPYSAGMSSEALKAFRGEKVIYIGEFHGCTADDEFHEILERDFTEAASVKIPLWWGLHDRLYLYSRKS